MSFLNPLVSITTVLAVVSLTACGGGANTKQPNDQPSNDGSFVDVTAMDMSTQVELDSEASEMLDDLGMTMMGDPLASDASGLTGRLLPTIFETQTSVDLMYAQAGAVLVERLNESLLLPEDIDVIFVDCGVANAFFIPAGISTPEFQSSATSTITMCHELTELFANFYSEPEQGFLVSTFVLMHELGHALVDNLDLPVLGIEESYVDGIASVFLGESNLAAGSVLAGFFFEAKPNSPFFDTHRAGPQRLGDLACWGVGADALLLEDPFVNDLATQLFDVGRNCEAEYQQQVSGLASVLNGNIRGGLNVLE